MSTQIHTKNKTNETNKTNKKQNKTNTQQKTKQTHNKKQNNTQKTHNKKQNKQTNNKKQNKKYWLGTGMVKPKSSSTDSFWVSILRVETPQAVHCICGIVWFGQYTEIAFLVSFFFLFVCAIFQYTPQHMTDMQHMHTSVSE